MKKNKIVEYGRFLKEEGLERCTVDIYVRVAKGFEESRGDWKIKKDEVKKFVMELGKIYKPATINLYTVALNRYLSYLGLASLHVDTRRIHVKRSLENVISVGEYKQLLAYAKNSGRDKYYAILKTLAGTGIRISELRYITIESVTKGYAIVYNKGRSREIYISKELQKELLIYSERAQIGEGIIFRGNGEEPITRGAVWQMLKKMADMTGIPLEKVHPHSFRHMMASMYMQSYGNIAELADILGHSSIETTRIYTVTTKEEKRIRLGAMGL